MTPRELSNHKAVQKRLSTIPIFTEIKKGRLPKPFNRMGSSRLRGSTVIPVSDDHRVLFLWRDGAILTDTAFYGFLMCRLANGSLAPILEMHWHPSHKEIHCKVPCKTDRNYTERLLVQAPELRISGSLTLDPRLDDDRLKLMTIFCEACGICLAPENHKAQPELW